jgi:hypothetical protein
MGGEIYSCDRDLRHREAPLRANSEAVSPHSKIPFLAGLVRRLAHAIWAEGAARSLTKMPNPVFEIGEAGKDQVSRTDLDRPIRIIWINKARGKLVIVIV